MEDPNIIEEKAPTKRFPWLDYFPLAISILAIIYFTLVIIFVKDPPSCPLIDPDGLGYNSNEFSTFDKLIYVGNKIAIINALACIVILFLKGCKRHILILSIILSLLSIIIPSFSPSNFIMTKPVIYLYPTKTQETLVQLYFKGNLDTTYPKYDSSINGWKVLAYPDGKLINRADNKEYSYLFWDGIYNDIKYDLSKGFVVKGEDTEKFLQDTLNKIGLTPKEYNEFIVYWLPLMKNNKYNLIHFADKEYTDAAPLKITPNTDSMLRVFMVFKPLDRKISIPPQQIKPFERKGFTVVEWGGTEIK